MSNDELNERLRELHGELKSTEALAEEERRVLHSLASEIEEILVNRKQHPRQYGGLSERLKEGVAHLEANHPRATLLMRELIDSLAYLGI
jgi:hypothetical protein